MDLATVGIGEGDDAFGVTADFDDSVVMLPVIVIAHIDHELGVGDSVGPIFEEVVCLGFAYVGAVGDAAGPVAVCEVSVLSSVCVVGRCY